MRQGMKLKKWVAVAAATMTLGMSSLALADEMPSFASNGLKVATEDNYSPFNFIAQGKATGINKDLLDELRTYSEFEVKQDILPWTGLLASVSAGQYDLALTGAIVTDARLKVFDFTPPIASAQHYFVARAKDDSTNTISDLDGKTVGLQAGSALLERLPELKEMLEAQGKDLGKVVEYQSYPEAYADLANGRVDYVINSVVSVNEVVKAKSKMFKKGEAVSGPGFVSWPVPKDNPELLAYLTEFFVHLKETGRLAELQEKWFGESFEDLPMEAIVSVEQYHKLTAVQ
ncbi:amino acid ABC transporter substrate-binding protein [Vibrio breoganii]|uniref:Amino acid ABC transporter substrate-binding protein n=1 Tax=Vibrio breoganii TaxID=553239 RepID=A0AAN1CSF7_9VIBR|nr:transporter substrate-binding domain-containing protein [Vibrio breoganii]ANO33558.1 amino acid ABC transporter substrate-binding protein [Vibrio breoganii]OCH73703.1 amino acid ABC transporter substrate-binding protein [Vibrio breoganii]OED87928.1 amino acid ABC transporter substrate-binding protein [Vibrio breoganii ZF-55]OEF85676.1 amino acid ABC transporter substrate-binding protein [Vibrio breoganii 1C10]PMG40897.1 amino acid ABC transporter substrate-binding protein [Vibrio breoganii]